MVREGSGEMNDSISTRGATIRILLVAIALSAAIVLGISQRAESQGARTQTSMTYDKDGNLITTETDYDSQNRVVEKRESKGGKLRKRTRYTYPNGFAKPNSTITQYRPDGKTPTSITNDDVDKDGNPTSSVTT